MPIQAMCWSSTETHTELRRWAFMESKLETALILAERLILHVENDVPPEMEVLEELKKLIPQLREEHGIPPPADLSFPGRA